MKTRPLSAVLAAVLLSGCNASMDAGGGSGALPDAVASIAAPYQDLATARLRPEDGCYWYRHTGPVETTLLPLRTSEGRPICTRPQS